jgi:hypothetical protein
MRVTNTVQVTRHINCVLDAAGNFIYDKLKVVGRRGADAELNPAQSVNAWP